MAAKKRSTKKKSTPVFTRGKDEMSEKCCSSCKPSMTKGCGSCAYFLGFLGSAIYYIQAADGFWMGAWGVIKSLVWPAFLVYELLSFVGA